MGILNPLQIPILATRVKAKCWLQRRKSGRDEDWVSNQGQRLREKRSRDTYYVFSSQILLATA